MSKIVLIDTSTDVCSVAIASPVSLLAQHEFVDATGHTKLISTFIKIVLNDSDTQLEDIQAVAIASGPGAYTSLRVGASVAKGFCFGLNIPLIAIDTLYSIAYQTHLNQESKYYIPLLDARRQEVYYTVFDHNMEQVSESRPHILFENSFLEYLEQGSVVFSGNGVPKTRNIVQHPNAIFSDIQCSAKNLWQIAFQYFDNQRFVDIDSFAPNYMKPPNITSPKK